MRQHPRDPVLLHSRVTLGGTKKPIRTGAAGGSVFLVETQPLMAEPADLSDYSVHELLHRMEMKSRGLKAGPFAELISRSAFITPWTEPLLSCARRDRLEGRTASNRPREGSIPV
jgi:hypothetical protein